MKYSLDGVNRIGTCVGYKSFDKSTYLMILDTDREKLYMAYAYNCYPVNNQEVDKLLFKAKEYRKKVLSRFEMMDMD